MAFFIGMGVGFVGALLLCAIVYGFLSEYSADRPHSGDVFWDNNDGHCLICKKLEKDCICNKTEDYSYLEYYNKYTKGKQ